MMPILVKEMMMSEVEQRLMFVTACYNWHCSQWVKSHMEDNEVFELKLCPCNWLSALRSGITVASEVHPRRGYCWLKTFPNTPQDGLKYSRLCNFWRPKQGPSRIQKKIKFKGNLFPIDKSEFPKLSWTTVHGCRAWFDDIPFSFKCTDIKTLFQSKKVICLGLLKLDYYSSCFLT